jgi:hypothetical protein
VGSLLILFFTFYFYAVGALSISLPFPSLIPKQNVIIAENILLDMRSQIPCHLVFLVDCVISVFYLVDLVLSTSVNNQSTTSYLVLCYPREVSIVPN